MIVLTINGTPKKCVVCFAPTSLMTVAIVKFPTRAPIFKMEITSAVCSVVSGVNENELVLLCSSSKLIVPQPNAKPNDRVIRLPVLFYFKFMKQF